jgi:hypothetical protein
MVGALGCYTTAASAHQAIVLRGCEASMGSAQLVRRFILSIEWPRKAAAARPLNVPIAIVSGPQRSTRYRPFSRSRSGCASATNERISKRQAKWPARPRGRRSGCEE